MHNGAFWMVWSNLPSLTNLHARSSSMFKKHALMASPWGDATFINTASGLWLLKLMDSLKNS